MFGSPRSPAAPWYGYSHDLDAAHVPSPYASSRSPTHSPAGDPTLELEIATSFNTVLNKVRDLKTDAAKPLRSPKRESPGKAPASPSSSDARMKRMEKMERRLTWVLENGVEQDGPSDGLGAGESESDLTTSAPSSASNSLAADAPMPEASKMLARRELERLIAERDEAVAALAKERTGSGRSPSELARLRSENSRLATENAELRAHLGHSRGRNGANTQGGGTSDLTAQKGEARELKRLADELQASMARSDRLERALHDIVSKTSAATDELVSSQGGLIRSGSSPGKPGRTAMNEVPASPSRVANDEACDLSGARPGPDFHDVEPKRLVSG
jgi:hypothetical protein